MNPLAFYESLSGADLERARELHRANPDGVDVRDLDPYVIEVVVAPIDRGSWPRRYGQPVDRLVVSDEDPVAARDTAFLTVLAFADDERVREGRAAVLARRVGDGS